MKIKNIKFSETDFKNIYHWANDWYERRSEKTNSAKVKTKLKSARNIEFSWDVKKQISHGEGLIAEIFAAELSKQKKKRPLEEKNSVSEIIKKDTTPQHIQTEHKPIKPKYKKPDKIITVDELKTGGKDTLYCDTEFLECFFGKKLKKDTNCDELHNR